MKSLYNRLHVLKVILNSNYGGDVKIISNVYEESYKIRQKIHNIKQRKQKIKRLYE